MVSEEPTDLRAGRRPLVVGHRGACGLRPEHTRAAYALAVASGADAVEVDVVSTRDGELVVTHEPNLATTTDVADHPAFTSRHTSKTIDGEIISGWFAEDLTLAELKALRIVERIPDVRPQNTRYDGRSPVLTLDEVVDTMASLSRWARRPLGLLIELKHSRYFRDQDLALEPRLARLLDRRPTHRDRPWVAVLSFEPTSLLAMRDRVDVPTVQLVDLPTKAPADLVGTGDGRTFADLVSASGLRETATFARGVGPDRRWLDERSTPGATVTPHRLLAGAHENGLLTMPYTFRDEAVFHPHLAGGQERAVSEQIELAGRGVGGFFTDQPATTRRALYPAAGRTGSRS